MLPWMEQLSIFLRILMIIQSFPVLINQTLISQNNIQVRSVPGAPSDTMPSYEPTRTEDTRHKTDNAFKLFGSGNHWKFVCLTCTPVFIAALFTTARAWKQPRCPSADEWIRKLWCIYTMEYYSAIKENTFESVLMRWMKLEPIIQSKVRKTPIKYINVYIWNLEIW